LRPRRRPNAWATPEEPKALVESLDKLARGLAGTGAVALGELFSRWGEIVGDAVAAHAQPVSLSGRVLTVAVDDPAWRTQLAYLNNDLTRRLAEVLGPGAVDSVRLVVRRH